MKLALISDIHDRVDHLATALAALAGDGPARADAVACLGDLCSPFVLAQLATNFGGPTHVVFGNNDADTFRMTRLVRDRAHVTLHGEFATLAFGGKRIALTHFPEVAAALDARSFDLIAYGHDHLRAAERRASAHVVNPGCLMGFVPGRGPVAPTFAVWDVDTDALTAFEVADGVVRPAPTA